MTSNNICQNFCIVGKIKHIYLDSIEAQEVKYMANSNSDASSRQAYFIEELQRVESFKISRQ